MISNKMMDMVKGSSVIRAMFEEGKKMAAVYGAENVYDFSLGNPSVPAPEKIGEIIGRLSKEPDTLTLHGYMNNAGFEDVRDAIAASLNKRFDTKFDSSNIIMSVGAAGGLNVILKTLLNPSDEVIVFAPYFGEYRSYVKNYDGIIVEVEPDTDTFSPKLDVFESKLTPRTKAVIINSPNNPTGVIYKEDTIKAIAAILEKKQKEFGTDIYIIADEPYRELVYVDEPVPYIPKYYNNTIVGYSFSKSLSLPGERIGYIVVPHEATDSKDIIAAANVATRILGFVNAPSLMQKVIKECLDLNADIESYDRNRKALYKILTEAGFECVEPEGAFYMFVKAPNLDDKAMVEEAKKNRILIVPGSAFACAGYVRIAYCVSYDTIVNSRESFIKTAAALGIGKEN